MSATVDGALLRAIAAHPRFIGSAALAVARERCAAHLESLGYSVRRSPFVFSTVPARLGMPTLGVLTILLVGTAGWLVRLAQPVAALGLVVVGGAGTIAVARWLAGPNALAHSIGVTTGVNLEAMHGTTVPRVWLVAHLDSKSQPLSLALRALATALAAAAWLTAMLVVASLVFGAGRVPFSVPLALAVAGGAPLILASIGDHSPGAVDNASGVLAVLGAAGRLAERADVGILITDGEEFGLAGAHAWARGRPPGTAFNCDTVDDAGRIRAVWSASQPRASSAAISRAAQALGIPCELRRLPAGILTDGVALQRAGWDCVTLSRATWRTLSRIHTRRDSLEHFEGASISEAADLLAAAVLEL